MTSGRLVLRNLKWFRRTNLAVILGVATAVAVLGGALLVGDSVRGSLRGLALARLGRTDLLVTGAGFFDAGLAERWRAASGFADRFTASCGLVMIEGAATRDENGARSGGVQIYGVDQSFWDLHGVAVTTPAGSEALISSGLARELGARPGETLALRIELPSAIPIESLHGRKDDVGRTMRVTVREVLPAASMGDFSLRPSQGEVRAVFLPLVKMQRNLEQDGRVNAILLAARDGAEPAELVAAAEGLVRGSFSLGDLGIRTRLTESGRALSVEATSAVISDPLAVRLRTIADGQGLDAAGCLTYLANTLSAGDRQIPYSLVTALDEADFATLARVGSGQAPPIILNEWASRDLGARVGDEVSLDYYLWEEEGRLGTGSARFRLVAIVPIDGLAADRELAPEYPGITGAESLSDWDPPFPLDLGRVRKVDEEYWDRYRTTPKAFVRLIDAQPLWGTRYGRLTSIRYRHRDGSDLSPRRSALDTELRRALDPLSLGARVVAVRAQSLDASRGATDFGAYFGYFSFFIVVSALLLMSLFFRLGVEQRRREIGLYRALGFPLKAIRAIFQREGLLLAGLGSLIGVAGALGYGWLMMLGLRTWWVGAVGTTLLELYPGPGSLIAAGVAGLVAGALAIRFTLRWLERGSPRSLLGGLGDDPAPIITSGSRRRRLRLPGSLPSAIAGASGGLVLLLLGAANRLPRVGAFFGAGTLLLVGALCFWSWWLRRRHASPIVPRGLSDWRPILALGFRNAATSPGRSVLCMALVAAAAFIIVSVEAFRRGEAAPTSGTASGTGGYALVAESLLPLVHNPDLPEGREELGLDSQLLDGVRIERFRRREGDDTSCLNLYQPRNPAILGLPRSFIEANRFRFGQSEAADGRPLANPWQLLDRAGDEVPVIADANSLAYVLHLRVGDRLVVPAGDGREATLRIVAALADSLFQGELLISEENFRRLFPREEGYRSFAIDAPPDRAAAIAAHLEDRLSDYGFDAVSAPEKLAGFHRVENTYLSTFQALGGLGLLLGTLGLATVLLRNVLERRRELALLRAIGYRSRHLAAIVVAENLLLLGCGLLTGTLCALLAIAPAIASRGDGLSVLSLGLMLIAIFATGMAASLLAVRAAVNSPVLADLRHEG